MAFHGPDCAELSPVVELILEKYSGRLKPRTHPHNPRGWGHPACFLNFSMTVKVPVNGAAARNGLRVF
jgi:hypothetical protein